MASIIRVRRISGRTQRDHTIALGYLQKHATAKAVVPGSGDELRRKDMDKSMPELAFGELLIELNSCPRGDPDRWFFKRVLRPRYGKTSMHAW